jgi:hypothetical protein
MELIWIALSSILTTCGISHLQDQQISQNLQPWSIWAAWTAVAAVSHALMRKTTHLPHFDDKEAQTAPAWSKPNIGSHATIIAVLVAFTNGISLYVPQQELQWSLVCTR